MSVIFCSRPGKIASVVRGRCYVPAVHTPGKEEIL
jgi:hypothetical protein